MAFDPVSLGIMGGGALLGGLSSLFSKKPRQQNVSRLTPQQLGWQSQAGNLAMQGLQNPYEGFEPIEQQARTQFESSIVPSLAERFTSMGSGGQRSSAFQGAIGQAGAGLAGNLAALRSQYGLQNRQLSQNLLGQAMQPSFDTIERQHQPGFLESSLGGLSGALGQYGAMQGLGMFGDSKQNQAPGSFGGSQINDIMRNPQFLQFMKSPKFMEFLQSQGIV